MFVAANLGMPAGGFIYFAVDFDATDDDINASVILHFQGVQEVITGNSYDFQYQVGAYSTRNVCNRFYKEVNIERAYIVNMLSGGQENLDFSALKLGI